MSDEDKTPTPKNPPPPPPPAIDQAKINKEILDGFKNLNSRMDAAESRPVAPAAPVQPKVTAATLRTLGPEQREMIEKAQGIPFGEVVQAIEAQELRDSQASTQTKIDKSEARALVNDAIEDAVSDDPQVAKLRGGIREFFQDVPVADQLDPIKLKARLEKAKVYARGKVGVVAPPVPLPDGDPEPQLDGDSPKPKGEGEGDVDDRNKIKIGDIKTDPKTNFRIEVGNNAEISEKELSKLAHPDDPNGVMFDGDGRTEQAPQFGPRLD